MYSECLLLILPLPFALANVCIASLSGTVQFKYISIVRRVVPPPPPLDIITSMIQRIIRLLEELSVPMHVILRRNFDVNAWRIREQSVWNSMVVNPGNFWLLTGETPESLSEVIRVVGPDIEARVRNPRNPRRRARRTRPYALTLHDRVLLCFLWLRNYPTFTLLSQQFDISVSNVSDIIYTVVPILYEHYHQYVDWIDEQSWQLQRNEYEQFPNAVGAIDTFAVQINRPQNRDFQRLYYRRDRGYHFVNFHVIVDNGGFFRLVRGRFLGHATDADSFRQLPAMGHRRQLPLPQDPYLLADGGYPAVNPLLTPFRRQRGGRLSTARYRANVELGRARVRVENRIGDVHIYRSVPGRAGRF
ncbi:hypothetical protein AC249_AIPGENE22364 [Exaiptasia diaphana]|nr:hypothetical protein AC249_AIPGENE22364 [Exaiptasia diaphana]